MVSNYFIVFVLCLVEFVAARDIPEYIHICKRSDPDVEKCVRESVEMLRPQLKSGIPELGIPSLEPLHIREITIFNVGPPSNVKAFLKNVNIHGLGDFQITKFKLNIGKNTARFGLKFSKVLCDGDYDVDVKFLNLPIKGAGKFTANITNIDGQGVLKSKIISVNGHRQMNLTSVDVVLNIGDYNIHLGHIFDGDEPINKAIVEAFSENKQELLEIALPFIQQRTSQFLLESANKINDGIDFDKVFPED